MNQLFSSQQPSPLHLEQNPPQHIMLYAVQRCWHSGPVQYQPLDFLRLFRSQRDAEEAAYHSAHAWARHHSSGNGGTKHDIKTLLLPSYPKHNPQGSSYGFISHGTLFWVRALQATIVTVGRHHNRAICYTEAYAVLTEGVIGGTGNRNSRRGTEVCEGRVFGGDASSRQAALEAQHRVQASLSPSSMDHPLKVHLETLPIGKPSEYASGNFLKDWPEQVLQPSNMVLADHQELHKREAAIPSVSSDGYWVHIRGSGSDDSSSSDDYIYDEGVVVDCPFEMPTAKRQRCGDGGYSGTISPTSSTTIGCYSTGNDHHTGLSGPVWQQIQDAISAGDDVTMM